MSRTNKFTPAPWEAVNGSNGETWIVLGPHVRDVIAHLPDTLPPAQVAANAKLIESAPLMLAAIQAASDLLRRCDGERCQPTDKPATNEDWDRVVELLKLAEVAATNKVLPLAEVVAKGGA